MVSTSESANENYKFGVRRDFDEIDIILFRQAESFGQFHDSERLVVHSDQAHFRCRNFTVYAM